MRRGLRAHVGRLVAGWTVAALMATGSVVLAAPAAGGADAGAALGFPTVGAYNVPGPPPANIWFNPPAPCQGRPTGQRCEQAAVYDLDLARGRLGFPPYALPADFLAEPPDVQTFILSDLDRAAYGEPLFVGVNGTLDAWAAAVTPWAPGTDPSPQGSVDGVPWYAWGGNAASGYPNVLYAYLAWMYDDGYGSGNVDCTSPWAAGCWGHRTNVLNNYRVCVGGANDGLCSGGFWAYLSDLSYGAAVGTTASGQPAADQLFVGTPSLPPYAYTWWQAAADGAGTNRYQVPTTTALKRLSTATVTVAGRTVRKVVLQATVSPPPMVPTTVRFTGLARHCGSVHVHGTTGKAVCNLRLTAPVRGRVGALFPGTPLLGASRSPRLVLRNP